MPFIETILDPYADERTETSVALEPGIIEVGTARLHEQLIPIIGGVHEVELGVFSPRIYLGNPTNDSDKYYSVWEQSDFRGGGQIDVLNVSSDLGRYRDASAEMMFPGIITNPLKTTSMTIATPSGNARLLADYKPDTTVLVYGAVGTRLVHFNATNVAWDEDDDLTAAPVAKGLVFDDELWIPLGSSGYDIWDGAAVVNSTDFLPISIVEWDQKVVALDATGQIGLYDGTWRTPATMKIRGYCTPRSLQVWWTPQREPAVFVVTDEDVWAVDTLADTLYRTGLRFPRHPDQGLGATPWRDDALYVSVATGVHQLALGGTIAAVGLDHDGGLPASLRGAIVDMEPQYNGVMVLVQGLAQSGGEAAAIDTLEEGMGFDESPVSPVSNTTALSSLQLYDGQGWFQIWKSPDATGTPTNVYVSQADGGYRLWWGYGSSFYTQPLRRSFYNPKQGLQLGIDEFETTSQIYTGRFDAGTKVFPKSASHLDCHLDPESLGYVDVFYQTDEIYPAWNSLGRFEGTGQQSLAFDLNGDGWAEGLEFRWIEFRYDLSSDDSSKSPIINWFTMDFLNIPLMRRSWNFQVPLVEVEEWSGLGPKELQTMLSELLGGPLYPRWEHLGEVHRVRVSSVDRETTTGTVYQAAARVDLIEMEFPGMFP